MKDDLSKLLDDPEMEHKLRRIQENASWFINNYGDLGKKFDRRYVAVYKSNVIDSDESVRILQERVEKNYPVEHHEMYVGFVTKEKRKLLVPKMD